MDVVLQSTNDDPGTEERYGTESGRSDADGLREVSRATDMAVTDEVFKRTKTQQQ
jgi:hypothetical protein